METKRYKFVCAEKSDCATSWQRHTHSHTYTHILRHNVARAHATHAPSLSTTASSTASHIVAKQSPANIHTRHDTTRTYSHTPNIGRNLEMETANARGYLSLPRQQRTMRPDSFASNNINCPRVFEEIYYPPRTRFASPPPGRRHQQNQRSAYSVLQCTVRRVRDTSHASAKRVGQDEQRGGTARAYMCT